jgi:hypothetical protein
LGKIYLTVDDGIDSAFRGAATKKYGFKKGNLLAAIEEAMQDWIEKINKVSKKVEK